MMPIRLTPLMALALNPLLPHVSPDPEVEQRMLWMSFLHAVSTTSSRIKPTSQVVSSADLRVFRATIWHEALLDIHGPSSTTSRSHTRPWVRHSPQSLYSFENPIIRGVVTLAMTTRCGSSLTAWPLVLSYISDARCLCASWLEAHAVFASILRSHI